MSASSILLLGIVFLLPRGTWASIGALPAHPLVVHVVVILLPLVALGLLLAMWKVQVFERFHQIAIALVTLCTLAALVAKSSGDSLAAAVGLPETHAEWGNILVPVAAALVGSTILFALFSFYMRIELVSKLLRVITALLSITTIGLTVLVGHSGAEAVWKDKYAAAKVPIALGFDDYSAEEVSLHNKATDCWTVVEGFVYDLTTFASRHPGGANAIKRLCGVNASERFLDEHDGQREPNEWLETLKIGRLK
ncbi:unannotated protein [freshwater metagenome]|uniref:Unannotated protein n=1 Tax=freshwater metagenome TaxID=449393 RepID=A0A6J6DJ51_9ZZZZ